jgi:plastocyanin
LGEATRRLEAAGQTTAMILRAPAVAGEHDYVCSLHPQMMRGVLEVK